jgi:dTDP-4-dehydrorhamnose reductase
MKILLTGKNGQLGFELQRALAPLGLVYSVNSQECDLSNFDAIRALIQKIKPNIIVNAAAYTAVDKAETDTDTPRAVNTTALQIIGEEATKIGAIVVHFSTDYVFDGEKKGAYVESDLTNPQSIYGVTKRDGEIALQQSCANHLIFRTSWVVGAHGNNFAKTMLRLASERETLNVVADQYGAPTSAALLADITAQIIGQFKRTNLADFPFGIYHLSASGETNWHEYARFVVQKAILAGKPIKVSLENIKPISTADYPVAAKRPLNSRLNTTLIRDTFDLKLPHWQDGVNHILQQLF